MAVKDQDTKELFARARLLVAGWSWRTGEWSLVRRPRWADLPCSGWLVLGALICSGWGDRWNSGNERLDALCVMFT